MDGILIVNWIINYLKIGHKEGHKIGVYGLIVTLCVDQYVCENLNCSNRCLLIARFLGNRKLEISITFMIQSGWCSTKSRVVEKTCLGCWYFIIVFILTIIGTYSWGLSHFFCVFNKSKLYNTAAFNTFSCYFSHSLLILKNQILPLEKPILNKKIF